eukprot:1216816-Rhodomonas_salina.1
MLSKAGGGKVTVKVTVSSTRLPPPASHSPPLKLAPSPPSLLYEILSPLPYLRNQGSDSLSLLSCRAYLPCPPPSTANTHSSESGSCSDSDSR